VYSTRNGGCDILNEEELGPDVELEKWEWISKGTGDRRKN
jgi:hypothetical protein